MGQFLGRKARAARSQTTSEMNIVWSPEAIEDLASLPILRKLRCRVGLPDLGSIQHDIDANGIEWKDDQTVSSFLQNTSL